jgi:hypothetical protein
MTELSEDEIAEFDRLVAELEQRLEQSFAAHDLIVTRQAANEQENARLRAELAANTEIKEPLAAISASATHAVELAGKLNDALKPAALDDKTREAVDELTRLLTGQLEQLRQYARRVEEIGGIPPPVPQKGASDAWAVEIDALRQEFPSEAATAAAPPGEDAPAPDVSEPALSDKQQG